MKVVTELTYEYGNWQSHGSNTICAKGLREFMNMPSVRDVRRITMTITDKKPRKDTDYYDIRSEAYNSVAIRTPTKGGKTYFPGTYCTFDSAIFGALGYNNWGYIYFHYYS